MEIYYKHNDILINNLIKSYMSSIGFRKSFDKEFSKFISHRYKGYTFCVIDSDGVDTIGKYYTLYMEDEVNLITTPILSINKEAICNHIDDVDFYMFYRTFLRNEKIETLLKS